jgi:hypothetical protein
VGGQIAVTLGLAKASPSPSLAEAKYTRARTRAHPEAANLPDRVTAVITPCRNLSERD